MNAVRGIAIDIPHVGTQSQYLREDGATQRSLATAEGL